MPSAEIQRIVLIVALAVTGYLLMLAWQEDYGQVPAPGSSAPPTAIEGPAERAPAPVADPGVPVVEAPSRGRMEARSDAGSEMPTDIPDVPLEAGPEPAGQRTAVVSDAGLVEVSTPTMTVWIDPRGGDIVGVHLPQYPVSLDLPDTPFVLLDRRPGHTYVAQSGLVGRDGLDARGERPLYAADARSYRIVDEAQDVVLRFADDDVSVEKRFRFDPADYYVGLEYRMHNQTSEPMAANLFAQLKRDASLPEGGQMFLGPRPYLGAALTTAESRYDKVDFEDLAEEALREEVDGGWIAILQHYFLSAWVANPDERNRYYGYPNRNGDGTYIVGFTGPAFSVAPGEIGRFAAGFYAGPKHQKRLAEIAPNLDLTVDYGILWWLAVPLFYLLDGIHGLIANWGVAIILMTLVIKLVLYPLSAASYKSMAKMRKLTPQLKRLQERHAGDRQRLSQEMMELYKKEKANPLGGCLPMLLQMPVFIALYWVLYESVELRQAPFFLWIDDLASMDPFFVLPILMGASMFFQQTLNPPMPDPMQARIMKMMPIMFTVLFLFFPAGLVLYWLVNNLLSMAQQWFITYRIEHADTGGAAKA